VVAVRSILLVFAFAAACSAEILEFTGSSCPACRHMDPIVRQLQDAGLTIRQIQVDQNPTLAAQYNVRAIPTFVLISNGKELDRIVGGASAEQLAQLYQKGNAPVIRGQNAAASTASTPLPGLDTGRMVPVHPRQELTLAAQARSQWRWPPPCDSKWSTMEVMDMALVQSLTCMKTKRSC
jgi:thioredoxin 1